MNAEFVIWCEKFHNDDSNCRPLYGYETEMFINDLTPQNCTMEMLRGDLKGIFPFQVIDKRAEFLKLKISGMVMLFLLDNFTSPSVAVMWVSFLRYIQEKNNLELVTMRDIFEYFPNGFPTNAGLDQKWDAQKNNRGDNMLDEIMFN